MASRSPGDSPRPPPLIPSRSTLRSSAPWGRTYTGACIALPQASTSLDVYKLQTPVAEDECPDELTGLSGHADTVKQGGWNSQFVLISY